VEKSVFQLTKVFLPNNRKQI